MLTYFVLFFLRIVRSLFFVYFCLSHSQLFTNSLPKSQRPEGKLLFRLLSNIFKVICHFPDWGHSTQSYFQKRASFVYFRPFYYMYNGKYCTRFDNKWNKHTSTVSWPLQINSFKTLLILSFFIMSRFSLLPRLACLLSWLPSVLT